MNTKSKYSIGDLTVLKSTFSDSVVARLINKSVQAVASKRYCLRHPDRYKARSNRGTARSKILNDESLKTADEHCQRWSDTDDAYVTSTMNQPVAEVASALGRSLAAVANRRCHLANA